MNKINLLLSWLRHLYVWANIFFNFHQKCFVNFRCNTSTCISQIILPFIYSREFSQSLYLILHILQFLFYNFTHFAILWIPLTRLLMRFNNEFAINLALSINFNLYYMLFVICSQFLSVVVICFPTGTEKAMYFLVFSPNQVSCPSFFSWLFYNKIIIIIWSIVKNHRNFLRYTII